MRGPADRKRGVDSVNLSSFRMPLIAFLRCAPAQSCRRPPLSRRQYAPAHLDFRCVERARYCRAKQNGRHRGAGYTDQSGKSAK